jgi:ABC-type multidrug transport system fused ATPase/permease subunit
VKDTIRKLRAIFRKKDKQFLLLLIIFSLFISVLETVGISAIMPFIAVATDFSVIHTNKYASYIYQYFNIESEVDFVIYFGIFLMFFYVFRSAINLFYQYVIARFAGSRQHILAYRIFENYIGMSYRSFIDKTHGELGRNLFGETSALTAFVSSLMLMISEIFVIILIYAMLLYVHFKITLVITIVLVANAILLTKTVSVKIKSLGTQIAKLSTEAGQFWSNTLRNFKMLKLKSEDEKLINEFKKLENEKVKVNILNITLNNFPRLFLEAIGFGIIIFVIIYLVYRKQGDISSVLPLLSMFVLALYRLLPSVNRIMTNYNTIMYNYRALDIIHTELMYDSEEYGDKRINFEDKIELKNVEFFYEKKTSILKNINLIIQKGQSVAFIGESGSGTSTLVDIIIGLYRPASGEINVDDKKIDIENIKQWRKKVGYIPQNVFLFPDTVAKNVAFGEEIDERKVKEVLKKANLLEFLETHQQGIDTIVGEAGVKLSGGQQQRVAIARALYNDPEILVLDEATSALDNETEAKIMDEIYDVSQDKTLIIIAHRLSTIERCEKVYKIENGKIVEQSR